jgi:S-DNA-T family DNA segregation ATPase FtsK/SpoIIIE
VASRRTLRKVLNEALQSLGEARAHVDAAQRLHAESAPRPWDTAGAVHALDQDLAALESDRDALESEVHRLGQQQRKRAEDFTRQAAAAVNRQRGLLDRLAAAAPAAAPGWLGRLWPPEGGPPILDDVTETPVDGLVRVGSLAAVPGHPAAPMLIPFLGRGHLQLDTDGPGEPAIALLRAIVLRVLASARPGDVRLLAADPAHVGGTFADFQALVRAGVQEPTAVSVSDFRDFLDWAERHVQEVQEEVKAAGKATLTDLRASDPKVTTPYVVLAIASFGPHVTADDSARLASLSRIGVQTGLHIVCVGYAGELHKAQRLLVGDDQMQVAALGPDVLVEPDGEPDGGTIGNLCRQLAGAYEEERKRRTPTLAGILPEQRWQESSVDELRAVVGHEGNRPFSVALNDATPHWFIGGRSGSGKTVFLLDTLYSLAARYGPDELALYLLDFKEGVSFAEFAPTEIDETWLPHARAVGIESDREYGLAVLRQLSQEMVRRSNLMKRYGVSKLADLRAHHPEPMPRIFAVIDEFQVLLQGDDQLAINAVNLLEELARKGRSYGVHLALASQSISSIRTLWTRAQTIFGQFPLRIALPGAAEVLSIHNKAADDLRLGQVIVNDQGGIVGSNKVVAFPDAHRDRQYLTELRRGLWEQRPAESPPPSGFRGSERQLVESDAAFTALRPTGRTPVALVGRTLNVALSTAKVALDASPGRHFAALGTSMDGAGMLQAAALSLGRQHEPGSATFYVGSFVESAAPTADAVIDDLGSRGHQVSEVPVRLVRPLIAHLADVSTGAESEWTLELPAPSKATYVVFFGVDAVSGMLMERDRERDRTGREDVSAVLRLGPGRSVHLLGWWRTLRRFIDDIGGVSNREYLATIAAMNVGGADLRSLLGQGLEWQHRENRALLVDQHTNSTSVIVPFVSPMATEELLI